MRKAKLSSVRGGVVEACAPIHGELMNVDDVAEVTDAAIAAKLW